MKNKNYLAWNLKVKDFPEKNSKEEQLKFLLRFSLLAPSANNGQPWKFKIEKNVIYFLKDTSSSLPLSDGNFRQLFTAMGCAIENLLIAADYYNFETNLNYFPNSKNEKIVASVEFRKVAKTKKTKKHLLHAIPKRQTNRGKYKNKKIPKKLKQYILQQKQKGVKTFLFEKKLEKQKLASIFLEAFKGCWANPKFRKELSPYIKNSLTRSFLGMPLSGFGIPLIPSFFMPFVLKNFNVFPLVRKEQEELFKKSTPAFLVISTKEDNPISWMESGRVLERIILEAGFHKVGNAIFAGPIQIGDHYKEIQKVTGFNMRPQCFCRLGEPVKAKVPLAPRLNLEQVLIQ